MASPVAGETVAVANDGPRLDVAKEVVISEGWRDMADLGRPVPDHQEVFAEPDADGGGRSVIFEVVERAAVDDVNAARRRAEQRRNVARNVGAIPAEREDLELQRGVLVLCR